MSMITSKRFDGVTCVLIDQRTPAGRSFVPVAVNSEVADFRGDTAKLIGGQAPTRPGTQGKVWSDNYGPQYYPSVYGLQWVPITDERVYTPATPNTNRLGATPR